MKTYLIRVCAGLNVLLLLMAVALFYENGVNVADGKDLAVTFLIVITPAFTCSRCWLLTSHAHADGATLDGVIPDSAR